jgi:hypothetical protein
MNWIATITKARQVSTPLLALITPDAGAAQAAIMEHVGNGDVPKVRWDCGAGLAPLNEKGVTALAGMVQAAGCDAGDVRDPAMLLQVALTLPAHGLLLAHNLHLFWDAPMVQQALANLRDPYKTSQRMLLALGCAASLPETLRHDVLVLEERLPDDAQLEVIAQELAAAAEQPLPDAQRAQVVAATRGLAAFDAEQVLALALRRGGYDLDALWEHKRTAVNATPGLTLEWGGPTFDEIGGLHQITSLFRQLQAGPAPAEAYIFIDEIEKSMAGAAGDTSGVSQDIHQALLIGMERLRARGLLLLGHPGTGKSFVAQAAGATFGKPTIRFDLGALKGSLVGQSEQNTRAALRVIEAIAGSGAMFVATCNRLEALSPELRRRFSMGTYFFDLPDAEERAAIWSLHLQRRTLTANVDACVRLSDGWSSANVRDCCDRAFELGLSIADAAARIVPAVAADPTGIARLRDAACGRFLSASYPGVYTGAADRAPAAPVAV